MPFRSERQRRFLYANHPDVAEKFAEEYGQEIKPKKPKAMTRPKRKIRRVVLQ